VGVHPIQGPVVLMRLRLILLCLAAMLLGLSVAGAPAWARTYVLRGSSQPLPRVSRLGPPLSLALPYADAPAPSASVLNAAGAMPTWAGSIVSPIDGKRYSYRMVGTSPLVPESLGNRSRTVPTDVIPVRFTFADSGHVFDPTAPDPACLPSPTASADSLTLASPIFSPHWYAPGGTPVGFTQYTDAFQRANFAQYVLGAGAINPGYHVTLQALNDPVISVSVPAGLGETVAEGCGGATGLLNLTAWTVFVDTTLLPSLQSTVGPSHFPIFLLYNVVMYEDGNPNDCCVLGFHSLFPSAGLLQPWQTYATADYDSSGLYSNVSDVSILSHEVGEWMDDPYGLNPTPSWGHVGQVGGCQRNLEVGDPLTGSTLLPVTTSAGTTYHLQELAFLSWFYRQSPSIGVNGWYSFNGTFTSPQPALC
jgi:hypothetical protein